MPALVLASQSPYRRLQLENFGLKFTAAKPALNEDQLKVVGPHDLTELTRFLALKKAESLAAQFPGALILGSDQLVDLGGERLDKPGTPEKAFAQLKRMGGHEHRLITSLAMCLNGESKLFTDVTTIRLKTLSDDMIKAYLAVDRPFDCAGSYKIEKAGLSLVQSINSGDPSAIQGLPMLSLMRGLDEYNLKVSELWL